MFWVTEFLEGETGIVKLFGGNPQEASDKKNTERTAPKFFIVRTSSEMGILGRNGTHGES